jgi:hypothetical protein
MEIKEAADIQSAAVAMPLSDRVNAAAGHVEILGAARAGPDRNADIQCKGGTDDEIGYSLKTH